MKKQVLSVVAGLIAWPALFLPSFQGLASVFSEHVGEDQSVSWPPLLIGLLVLSVVVSLITGWITAALAPGEARKKCVTIVGVVNLVFGIVAQVSGWDLVPVWYHLPFLALLLPAHLMGGAMRGNRK